MPARWAITVALGAVLGAGLALWWLTRPQPLAPPPPALALQPVGFADLPGWSDDRHAGALRAFRGSCQVFARWPETRRLTGNGVGGTAADWRPACEALALVPDGDDVAAKLFLERHFTPFAVTGGGSREGLFTGYYEPLLNGSRQPAGPFREPIYRLPDDLVSADLGRFAQDLEGRRIVGRLAGGRLVPYQTRAQIDGGALRDRDLELFYVDDPVAAFFLHIQGSGRIRLPDGSEHRVGYAGKNGHPYFAIGRTLIDRGALSRERVSLQSIRDWLHAHPEEARQVMQANRSYVFFRELPGAGPQGALGIALTPARSLAVDRRLLPLGAPLWLVASRPGDAPAAPDVPLRRLLVAQDTGGAIRGAVRGDVFWGHGERAEHIAGHMRHPGRWYLLLPRALQHPGPTG